MKLACVCLVGLLLWTPDVLAKTSEPVAVKVAIHLHSRISTGELEPSQIFSLAERAGLDGVILTDSLLRRWEYGLWPVRSLLKWVVEQPSVLTFGPERYLRTMRRLNEGPAGVVAIAGLEAAPFYYWQRSPFDRRGGQIRGGNQHLLILGLHDPRAIRELPIATCDPYHGNQGARPYQRLIDAVGERGGLVFWAHPAAPFRVERHGPVEEVVEPYPHLLELTTNYQGFAIADLGTLSFVEPGGVWDRLLLAYCRGTRTHPTWIIGELDWRNPRQRPLDQMVTQLLVTERSIPAILQALRMGRMWVVFRIKAQAPTLSRFTLTDEGRLQEATMGDTLTSNGPIHIHAAGERMMAADAVHILLVKDGQVIQTEDIREARFDLEWTDPVSTRPSVYRVIIKDSTGLIYTNPIFVNLASSLASLGMKSSVSGRNPERQ